MTDERREVYTDSDGNRCDLATLCRREPGWAANRIDTLLAERARHQAELESLERYRDLVTAQILMVGSELCGDPKLDPEDWRDPRHTPTLSEAARLRRERDALAEQVRQLEAERDQCQAAMSERCRCQWEAGDSPCPMHGEDDE